MTGKKLLSMLLVSAVAGLAVAASPAVAHRGGGNDEAKAGKGHKQKGRGMRVRKSGACGETTMKWRIKLRVKRGTLRADFHLKRATPGSTWNIVISHNGTEVKNVVKTDKNNDGSVHAKARRLVAADANQIDVVATQVNADGSAMEGAATCSASAAIPEVAPAP